MTDCGAFSSSKPRTLYARMGSICKNHVQHIAPLCAVDSALVRTLRSVPLLGSPLLAPRVGRNLDVLDVGGRGGSTSSSSSTVSSRSSNSVPTSDVIGDGGDNVVWRQRRGGLRRCREVVITRLLDMVPGGIDECQSSEHPGRPYGGASTTSEEEGLVASMGCGYGLNVAMKLLDRLGPTGP